MDLNELIDIIKNNKPEYVLNSTRIEIVNYLEKLQMCSAPIKNDTQYFCSRCRYLLDLDEPKCSNCNAKLDWSDEHGRRV